MTMYDTVEEAGKRVPVAERALLRRINRKLGKENQQLRAARGRTQEDLGPYYIIHGQSQVVGCCGDLEAYGRFVGALKEWEELV